LHLEVVHILALRLRVKHRQNSSPPFKMMAEL